MVTNSPDVAIAQSAPSPPPPAAETVIAARGLRCAYDGHEVVHGVDLDVRRGEIVAVLGPNGAGKTTTVEVLEGFRPAAGGDVSVLGADPTTAGAAWRERIGVVLQDSEPEPGLTVRQCVELYAGYYAHPRDVRETVELVGLGEQAGKTASELSGGQRRRLDVALALVGNPELLFLDEPTTGFDPSARRAAWALVRALRDLGTTILLTTHYMEEAEVLADRIVVLGAGRVVAEGTPRTLGGRDRAAAEITFVLPAGVGPGDLPASLDREVAVDAAGGARLRSTAPTADLRALTGWAVERGVELPELRVARPSLEDIYLSLTTEEGVA